MIVVTVAQGSTFKARWLWPVVPGLSVAVVMWAVRVLDSSCSPAWRKGAMVLAWGMPVLAIVVSGLRWSEPTINARRCNECWTDRPANAMAAELHARHGPALRVLAGDTHLAGILAAASPRILAWAMPQAQLPPPVGFATATTPCIAVWSHVDRAGPAPMPLQELIMRHALPIAVSGARSWPFRHAFHRLSWLQTQPLDGTACARARPAVSR